MTSIREFKCGRKRVTFDSNEQRVVFENCVERRSFWNLIPLKKAECRFDEVWHLHKATVSGIRLAGIEMPQGTFNVSDEDWDDFETIVAMFESIANPVACPDEVRNPRKSPVTIALFFLIFLGIAAVLTAVFMGWV